MTRMALLCAAATAVFLAGCTVLPGYEERAEREELVTATATIEAVDREERTFRLRNDETGEAFTVIANDGIKNLEQLEVNDVVQVEYYESVAVQIADPADPGGELTTVIAAEAPDGEKPGLATITSTSMVVEVVSYVPETGFATFIAPDGETQSTTVAPELRSFAETVSPGDRVLVTITEAVAATIQEVGS